MDSFKLQAQPRWWKEGVCYQVWPLSFKDSNADGNGDIPGLISKLDYLKNLGVGYIWMSPMYQSPRDDYGYDISDYENVDPVFGTLEDMDRLIEEVHSRGMRLVLDLVINHTSDQHRWFKESAKSRDNEFSNYYMWRDPKIVDGKKCPPNNWRSLFGGSAWVYVEARDQYYLRLFLESMPDLNWEDETVREAIWKSSIDFWLSKGIDGFRVDVVGLYSKDISFPDAPVVLPDEEFQMPAEEMIANGPGMHKWLTTQRKTVIEKYGRDIVLIGELGACSDEDLEKYLSPNNRELDMVFNMEVFRAVGVDFSKPPSQWTDERSLVALRKALMTAQQTMTKHGLWSTSFFENHDQSRSVNNYGSRDPAFQPQSCKLLALLLATMSGTLFVYQGQEIGMTAIPSDWPRSELRDPFWIRSLDEAAEKYPDDPVMLKRANDNVMRMTRDNARTPVQWSREEPCAGFSTTKPWIRVNDNFKSGINVEEQEASADSVLSYWKKVLQFRKSHAGTMIYGHTEFVDNENEHVLSVIKHGKGEKDEGKKLLVVMNRSDSVQSFPTSDKLGLENTTTKSFVFGTDGSTEEGELQPWEGRVFEL